MVRAHKIRLYPNKKQETYFKKACGISRSAFNWALETWQVLQEFGEKPTANKLDKLFNAIKEEMYPWTKEITKWATQLTIQEDLKSAFDRFFKKLGKYPKFKKKGVKDSFRFFFTVKDSITEDKVSIPRLGWVKLAQPLRYKGKLLYGIVSRRADKWFISISVEVPDPVVTPRSENQAIGVDLGVKALATLSNGTVIPGRKVTCEYKHALRHLQKELSRRRGAKKGERKSKNFRKTQNKIANLYLRMCNIRDDQLHKLTSMLTKQYSVIGIEDLNVTGMLQNHKLAGAIADMSFFEFRRQLEYKAKERGCKIVIADPFFASSKTCNCCGSKNSELQLKDRVWTCKHCGTVLDRDVNAAINLRNNAVGVTVSAC